MRSIVLFAAMAFGCSSDHNPSVPDGGREAAGGATETSDSGAGGPAGGRGGAGGQPGGRAATGGRGPSAGGAGVEAPDAGDPDAAAPVDSGAGDAGDGGRKCAGYEPGDAGDAGGWLPSARCDVTLATLFPSYRSVATPAGDSFRLCLVSGVEKVCGPAVPLAPSGPVEFSIPAGALGALLESGARRVDLVGEVGSVTFGDNGFVALEPYTAEVTRFVLRLKKLDVGSGEAGFSATAEVRGAY
jgi:hypothetical protein